MINCQGCAKALYPLERMTLNAKVYHKTGCAKCAKCNANLTPHNFAQMGDVMLCKPHYMQAFSESGGSYNMPSAPHGSNRPLPPIPQQAKTKLQPPPIPQSMLNKQQKPASKLSAFLNQHSTPVEEQQRPAPAQEQQCPAPAQEQHRPLPPTPTQDPFPQLQQSSSKLTAFLGKNTTSLKDIRIAAPAPRSTRPPASLMMRERMQAFTSPSATTTSLGSRPLSTVGGGMTLKDRLRAYTSAAASSSNNQARQAPLLAAATPMTQRLQTYRQAANASSSQVPTAIIVANDENIQEGNNVEQDNAWRAMREVCAKAKQELDALHACGVKQEQAHTELTNELARWVIRLDRFANNNN